MDAGTEKAKTDDSEARRSEHLFFSILRIAWGVVKKQVQAYSIFQAEIVQKDCNTPAIKVVSPLSIEIFSHVLSPIKFI